MKRMGTVFLAEVILTSVLATVAGAQSQPLGDYARSVRKDEKPASAKKYDNDNLPTSDKISIVGQTPEASATEDANPAPAGNTVTPAEGATAESQMTEAARKADGTDAQIWSWSHLRAAQPVERQVPRRRGFRLRSPP